MAPVSRAALAILGTSRSRGNTRLLLDRIVADRAAIVDLNDKRISPYDYAHRNGGDDFLTLATEMAACGTILFATPVYWYSMSSPLKTFFDRLTDLVRLHKPVGRALAGTRVYLVVSSASPELPPGFEVPFELTCAYVKMHWEGAFHA